ILCALGIAIVFFVFEMFPLLPDSVAPGGRLSLGSSLWFSILAAFLAWTMPGINALVGPFTRPDLLRTAQWRRAPPWLGGLWTLFLVSIFWSAFLKPIYQALKAAVQPGSSQTLLVYFNQSGITAFVVVVALGIVIYVAQSLRNRSRGI